MGRQFSLYLDVLRLLGAVMVLLAHWAFPRFTGTDHSWMRQHDLGGDGVVIFFVLSGLLIAFTAERRQAEGPKLFAADRLSRLWSVALPILLFGIFLDWIGQAQDPDLYAISGYQGEWSVLDLITGATFTNQLWFTDISPGANSPYWSLGYEAWYYAIFAGFFFAPRRLRWYIAGGLAFIAGPKILLLAPSWLMGVWLWSSIKSGRLAELNQRTAMVLTVVPLLIYLMAHANLWHVRLSGLTYDLLGEAWYLQLGASDSFVWAAILGLLVTAHLAGVVALLQGRADIPALEGKSAALIRWLAGGSFALYLVHYPVLNLLGALLPGDVLDLWRQLAILSGAVIVSYIFAELTERRRPALRAWLRRLAQNEKRRRKDATALSNASS